MNESLFNNSNTGIYNIIWKIIQYIMVTTIQYNIGAVVKGHSRSHMTCKALCPFSYMTTTSQHGPSMWYAVMVNTVIMQGVHSDVVWLSVGDTVTGDCAGTGWGTSTHMLLHTGGGRETRTKLLSLLKQLNTKCHVPYCCQILKLTCLLDLMQFALKWKTESIKTPITDVCCNDSPPMRWWHNTSGSMQVHVINLS